MSHPQRRADLLGRIADRRQPINPPRASVPAPETDPQPPRRGREHLYGSAYCGPMNAAEVIAQRRGGGLGGYRRSLAPSSKGDRRRAAAVAITGLGPDIMWPE